MSVRGENVREGEYGINVLRGEEESLWEGGSEK